MFAPVLGIVVILIGAGIPAGGVLWTIRGTGSLRFGRLWPFLIVGTTCMTLADGIGVGWEPGFTQALYEFESKWLPNGDYQQLGRNDGFV